MDRSSWRYGVLLIILICAVFGAAQDSSDLLKIHLYATNSELCVGPQLLEMNVVIENATSGTLTFSPDGKWNSMMITRYVQDRPQESRSIIEEVPPKSWASIGPRQSLILPMSVQLKGNKQLDPPIFSNPGWFSIQIGFAWFQKKPDDSIDFKGSIRSDKAFIKIQKCSDINDLRLRPNSIQPSRVSEAQ